MTSQILTPPIPSARISPAQTRRDLALFAALTALISGVLFLALGLSGANIGEGAGMWVFGVATSGPSLAALVLFVVRSRRRPRVLGQSVSAPWLWAPLAIVLGALPTVIANLIAAPGDIPARLADAPVVLADFGGTLMFVVLFLIAGPLAEEFGWRGYAQPRLRRSLGIISTSVVLGLAWALWHVPLYFLPGTGQHETGLFTLNGLIFMVSCIPLSLIYLFVSETLGGRVWAAILIHFSGNAIGAFLPSEAAAVSLVQLATTVGIAVVVYVAWMRKHSAPRGWTVSEAGAESTISTAIGSGRSGRDSSQHSPG